VNTAANHSGTSGSLARLKLRKPPEARLRNLAAAMLESSNPPDRRDLVRFSAMDPLMAVWILKRANSFYYGLRSTVDNLSHAVEVLDPNVVAGMFADTPDASIASPAAAETNSPDALTKHSVATAILAHWLDDRTRREPGCAFTAGLMHDIGKHVFALNFQDEAAGIYRASPLWDSLSGADLLSVEQLAFGLDHTEVGEFVARKMHFPAPLAEILRMHHDQSSLPPCHRVYRMSRIVNAASLGATALGYGAGVPVSWEQCVQDDRWEKLVEEELVPDDSKEHLLDSLLAQKGRIETFLDLENPLPETLSSPSSNRARAERDASPRSTGSGPRSGIGRASVMT